MAPRRLRCPDRSGYFSIPVALSIFVSKRRDVEFGWNFWAFAIFIMACGLTHILSIYTLWVPIYGIEGFVKAITAIPSVVTAAVLWPLLPTLLAIPSPGHLKLTQFALEEEARYRREAEEMLRHSQNMGVIGQPTGGVAHDFNNLLTIVIGNLELAERSLNATTGLICKVTFLLPNNGSSIAPNVTAKEPGAFAAN